MKNKIASAALGLSVLTAAAMGGANVAHAAPGSAYGTITFVGTQPAEAVNGGSGPFFRLRIHGTCGADGVVKDRWLGVRIGRTDGTYNHNDVAFRNAYSTVLAAFMSGRSMQIDGVADCAQGWNVVTADMIGMY